MPGALFTSGSRWRQEAELEEPVLGRLLLAGGEKVVELNDVTCELIDP